MGALANERSDYTTARREYEAALATYGAGDDRDKQETLSEVGLVYSALGERALELSTAQEAVALASRLFGVDHPRTANARRALGLAYYDGGDYAHARVEYDAALAILERVYGKDAPIVGKMLNYAAAAYARLGKPDRARELMTRSLAILEATNGPRHPLLVTYLSNLAGLYGDQPAKATELLERALEIARTVDPAGEEVAQVLTDYANVNLAAKDPAAALPRASEARTIFTAIYGADSVQVTMASLLVGNALVDLGRSREAVAVLAPLPADTRQPPLNRALCGQTLAQARWRIGDHARAIDAARAALELARGSQDAQAATVVDQLTKWLAAPS
jgi:tetratricopeptide (TPR) repeat protein